MEKVLTGEKIQNLNSGTVVRYRQQHKGLHVDNRQIVIKLNTKNEIRSFQNYTIPINEELGITPSVTKEVALNKAKNHLREKKTPIFEKTELMVHIINFEPFLCWKINLTPSYNGYADWSVYVDAGSGQILGAADIADHINGTGNVFGPSPTYTAMIPYGTGGFVDYYNLTNDDLDGELMEVELLGIDQNDNGTVFLRGGNARIVDDIEPFTGIFTQSNSDFSFDRSDAAFEAVMSYYYVDRSMRYVNASTNEGGLGVQVGPTYTGNDADYGLKIDPHAISIDIYGDPNPVNAGFSPSAQRLQFGDGRSEPGVISDVDAAEDAAIILHELGHALHYWLTDGARSKAEGLNEGLSDYWGVSENRNPDNWDTYRDWQEEFYQVSDWGLLPDQRDRGLLRTTNYKGNSDYPDYGLIAYCDDYPPDTGPGKRPPSHESGQWFSTPLMKIFNDIGKYKTDLMVIETMPLLVNDGTNSYAADVHLQDAGKFLYQTAEDFVTAQIHGFNSNDLCIIYQHLDEGLCISQERSSTLINTNPNLPGSLGQAVIAGASAPDYPTIPGNVYMKDNPGDNGTESNPFDGPMWLSEDIWVRQNQDGILEHQNPEYKLNDPNYVYVRIRGNGCNTLDSAKLQVYYSKASTGLEWPLMWEDYAPVGGFFTGDEITEVPVDIPAIAPGDEWVVSMPWNVPDPDVFPTEKHHFCLLARIISSEDIMSSPETSEVHVNARNNNNIAWKNISIFDNIPNNIVGPVSVFLGCDENFQGGSLKVASAQNSLGKSIYELGNVYVELKDPLKSEWINAGMPGEGFEIITAGELKVTGDDFRIGPINIADCSQYVDVSFEPFNRNRFAAFDLIQYDNRGIQVGGERFEYRPDRTGTPKSFNRVAVKSAKMSLYPNPGYDKVTLEIKQQEREIEAIQIFDAQGRKMATIPGNQSYIHEIDISTYAPGLYIIIVQDTKGEITDSLKFTKV